MELPRQVRPHVCKDGRWSVRAATICSSFAATNGDSPSQVEDVLSGIDGVTPHYRIVVDNETGLDRVVHVELKPEACDSF